MIVGYARVSTNDQTPELQLHALKRAKCKRIFVEQKSDRNMNRPELVRCLAMLRKGDTLVIWKLDRLGRSLRDLIEIVARLEREGIQFVSLTEDINTKTTSGKLIFHVFAVLAEFERNLIRERTMAGLATARARGRVGGAKKRTTTQQDKQIRALWESGKFTGAEIASQFGISVPTFFRRVRPRSLTSA
jgi:DNA invertase Pin-like site-specific DNA recombinase